MKNIICIRQPGYLPYIGFFKKIQSSDVFVYLDDVQYERGDWDNRNKIKTSEGSLMLTVPVYNKFNEKLNEVKIVNTENWQKKHLVAIHNNYHKSSFFGSYWKDISQIFTKKYEKLIDLNVELIEYFKHQLGLDTECVNSSTLNISEKGSEKLLKICQKLDAKIYLSGELGKNYLNEYIFLKNNINIIYEKFEHPIYLQRYNNFIPNLSVIDILFNEGEKSKKILENCKNY